MLTPNEADIDVVLTPVKASPTWPDGIKFELVSDLLCDGRLTFHNNGKPGFKLNFNIVDDSKTGYLFPDDEAKAMWVKPVQDVKDDCPKTESHWEKFKAKKVECENRTLRVFNKNDGKELFKFTLLFTKTPSQNGPCIEFDPIGDNRNGFSLSANAMLATGAGVVALTLGVVAFFRERKSWG